MKKLLNILLASLLVVSFIGCNRSKKSADTTPSTEALLPATDSSLVQEDKNKNIVGMLNGTIYCIPSPYDMMNHIKSLKLPYLRSLPNSVLNASNYESSCKKLLNMGIYSIDISYMTMYQQMSDALNYFSTLKSLANQVELASVFDAATMEELEHNMGSQDTLFQILSKKFYESDKLLKGENEMANATLLMTGCWIESLYLLTQIHKQSPNEVSVQKIAEHKLAAEAILNVLRPYYRKSEDFKVLIDHIVDICYEFDGIDYSYTYQPPKTYPNNNLTIITSESKFIIMPKHISNITGKIEALRNSITR